MQKSHHALAPVVLDGAHLTLESFVRVARFRAPVSIDPAAIERMQKSRAVVDRILEKGQPAYGINTGFGAFSKVAVPADDADLLQNNLILSHCTGTGTPYPPEVVRGMMLLRANALCHGFSGIRPEIVQTLVDMINHDVLPIIPEKGSLGASGDLAPLSHMALVLLGKGEALYEGERMPGGEAMRLAGLATYSLRAKEGLALINGTQAMTAVGALAACDGLLMARQADIIASLSLTALKGVPFAFDERIHALRPHPGQALVAKNMRQLIKDCPVIAKHQHERVQDAYALRCVPQVHGACRDALHRVIETLEIEMNAVTDNPLIFADGTVLSGGNFHGEPVALALDYLAIALSEIANIAERRLERLVNPQLSGGLPAFLVKHGGLNSGFMIVQYAAASMVSENKVLAHPASVDSIPSSANQEDHVSMGTTAARKARLIAENSLSVLALEWMCAVQALELLGEELSPLQMRLCAFTREHVAFYDKDREIAPDIATMNRLIRSEQLWQEASEAIPGLA